MGYSLRLDLNTQHYRWPKVVTPCPVDGYSKKGVSEESVQFLTMTSVCPIIALFVEQ